MKVSKHIYDLLQDKKPFEKVLTSFLSDALTGNHVYVYSWKDKEGIIWNQCWNNEPTNDSYQALQELREVKKLFFDYNWSTVG